MKFTEQQILSLSESIEHWYNLCTDKYTLDNIDNAKIGSEYCACCEAFPDVGCKGCPIAEFTDKDECRDTPYYYVLRRLRTVLDDQNDLNFQEVNREMEWEYGFLVDVMMSRDPWNV